MYIRIFTCLDDINYLTVCGMYPASLFRIEIGFRGGPVPMLPSAVDGTYIVSSVYLCTLYMRICNCALQSVIIDCFLEMSQLIPCLDNGPKYVSQHTLVESATGIE